MNDMDTPICDFVNEYKNKNCLRLHMPGHKGESLLGFEKSDITEIKGADSLYEADGIIAESEKNASLLFGCDTYYSTEGSSQCIRAMIYLINLYAKSKGEPCRILAARNVHKTFLSGAALLDVDVSWWYASKESGYLSASIPPDELGEYIRNADHKPTALYITSPDYLGKTADLKAISEVCHKYGVLLAVDNAHGAYLRFLPESRFPTDLGADICCSSAHKTLPVVTGGAYLHLSSALPSLFKENAKKALSLFGSTSPSYLILQSLDKANEYICASYKSDLVSFIGRVRNLKEALINHGYNLYGDEELKITIAAKSYGYKGTELAELLREKNIEIEFADPDFAVMMLTPSLSQNHLTLLESALLSIEKKPAISEEMPEINYHKKMLSLREALLTLSETVPVEKSADRILAEASVGCPPAVPIVMCGEIIKDSDIEVFRYYGIEYCNVVK